MSTDHRPTIVLLAFSFCASGCASWFLRGAELANGPPASPIAAFSVVSCADGAGQPVQGPTTSYYLAQEGGGQVLYEIEASGSGARITNGWSDATGMYFFVWVGNGPGWRYFFPADASQPPIRLAFEAHTYTGDSSDGVTRPVGTPSATCVMQRTR